MRGGKRIICKHTVYIAGIMDHDSIGGADDKCISIYAANGALVAEHYGHGYVALASGTYVVKVDGHSAKMYVK